ncbi:MAG: thiamine-phosphate kinase [Rhizobiales bacterium]|nr:thiamine-phosphate kinase [Hyphomicrobiales bacterium]
MSTTSNFNNERVNEDTLIARYFAPLATHAGARGLLDDAALVSVPEGSELVVTLDTLVEGVHFRKTDPADLIARKALRVNLSDLAAKGAKPHSYFLSLGLNKNWSEDWIARFVSGLKSDQEEFGLSLFGGDTTMSPGPLTISITAMGLVDKGKMVARYNARAGDMVFITGTIGDAALGLQVESTHNPSDAFLQQRYLLPEPRTGLVDALATYANAAMDISDGLLGDLQKMCLASGVGASIERNKIPLSLAAQEWLLRSQDIWDKILIGGDDYEILAAVPGMNVTKFVDAARVAGIDVTWLGQFEKTGGIRLSENGNQLILPTTMSYSHF